MPSTQTISDLDLRVHVAYGQRVTAGERTRRYKAIAQGTARAIERRDGAVKEAIAEGYSYRQVADFFGVSVGKVQNIIRTP